MSTFLMHYRTVWDDYFTGNPTKYNSTTYNSRQTPSDGSVYVSNCLFISITSSSNGGALYCTSASYFIIDSSSFFSCKTSSNYYGALYFSNTNNGQSVLYKVCGYDCCSTYTSGNNNNYYQFGRINVNNDVSRINNVNYLSIARCVNDNSNSHYTFALAYGKICCPSINISLSKCYRRSGITSWPYGDSNSYTSSFTYSSFTDNHATGYDCFWLNTGGAKYEIKSCNILRNTQDSLSYEGTFYINGYLKIEDSCILENEATYIFYQPSTSYTITLSNCTVDKTTCNLNVVTHNICTKNFILALNHMSNQLCHAEYDSAGTLTPIIQTPSSSKKPIDCYTCRNIFLQPQVRDVISLTNIFIFNFINPYSSCYLLY
jgi:hypothetical protein